MKKTRVRIGSTHQTKAAGKQPKPPRADRPMSGLDAAAKVLADAGKPMRIGEVMEAIQKGGLWASRGKTPAATIFAAITREISAKGSASRFVKKDRGLFVANGKKAAATPTRSGSRSSKR